MSDVTAIEKANGEVIEMAPRTTRAILTAEALKESAEQRRLLGQYVREQMIDGTDFGTIPGTPKPTLLKPGAEKLVELFRCTPVFKLARRVESFEAGQEFFHYIFRVQLVQRDVNAVVAEGYGSANSMEGRYRWRTQNRHCPKCNKETIIKGKEEYGGGWLCFAKKGGCGAKYADDDKAITEQPLGRVANDDVATMANTILKMAKKRAMVDGAIALARASDLFTQDVEDIEHAEVQDRPKREPKKTPSNPTVVSDPGEFEKVIARIRELASACGLSDKNLEIRLKSLKTTGDAKQALVSMEKFAAEMANKSEPAEQTKSATEKLRDKVQEQDRTE